MTFRELGALREQWKDAREYQLLGSAAIQATLHNHWYQRPDGRKFSPADFMPGQTEAAAAADDRTQAERIEDQKLAILAALQMAAAINGVN